MAGVDCYAERLARGSGLALNHAAAAAPPAMRAALDQQLEYHRARTGFFDSWCADAAAAGIRQFVNVGAGLDSRAWRLDWPACTTVYEIDQPPVLSAKQSVMATEAPAADSTKPIGAMHD